MCGFIGVFQFGSSREPLIPRMLTDMRDKLTHRGPDDEGLFIAQDHRIGMGFRRLSIIDLSPAGHQPMSNEDGSIWLTFNGEIYNHRKLRPDLIARGHQYRSQSDTETLLHLYEERGVDFVDALEGMFAIALWDSTRGQLHLIRDRLGVKPLYYTVVGNQLIYASEIKAILAHPGVHRDVDPTALYHYLTFVTTPAPLTLFAGIRKVSPGQMVTFDVQGRQQERQYWDALVRRPARPPTEAEAIVEIRRLLDESVEKRMMSDVPFGVFLSGGIDSSTNVALMARHTDMPLNTYTVGFKRNDMYNELQYARQIAREFRTNHREVMIDQEDLVEFLPKLIYHQDEPIADPVCVPLYYVSKLVRDTGTIVAQVGEGADELFCGYNGYMMIHRTYMKAWRYFQMLPAGLRKTLYAASQPVFKVTRSRHLSDFARRAAYGEELFWGGAIAFFEMEKKNLVRDELRSAVSESGSLEVVQRIYERIRSFKPDVEFLESMIYLELKLRLAELLLMRVDKITMATSIEARVPFLDHKLVEFAMTIPTSTKIRNDTAKYILKKAVEGIIPDNIIYRKKQGFGVPVSEWLVGSLGDLFYDRLLNSGLRRRGFLNYDFIEKKLSEHRAGRANNGFQLWNLFNLTLWYDYWVEGREVA